MNFKIPNIKALNLEKIFFLNLELKKKSVQKSNV